MYYSNAFGFRYRTCSTWWNISGDSGFTLWNPRSQSIRISSKAMWQRPDESSSGRGEDVLPPSPEHQSVVWKALAKHQGCHPPSGDLFQSFVIFPLAGGNRERRNWSRSPATAAKCPQGRLRRRCLRPVGEAGGREAFLTAAESPIRRRDTCTRNRSLSTGVVFLNKNVPRILHESISLRINDPFGINELKTRRMLS